MKNYSPWEGLMLEKFVETVLQGKDQYWSKRRVWGALLMRRKEVQPSFPALLCPWQGGGRELGLKLSLKRREGREEVSLRFGFCFLLLYSDLTVIKLNRFPQVTFVLLTTVIAEWSLPAVIPAHEPSLVFSLPCPDEEGSDRAALVGTCNSARINLPHSAIQSMHSHGSHIDIEQNVSFHLTGLFFT